MTLEQIKQRNQQNMAACVQDCMYFEIEYIHRNGAVHPEQLAALSEHINAQRGVDKWWYHDELTTQPYWADMVNPVCTKHGHMGTTDCFVCDANL